MTVQSTVKSLLESSAAVQAAGATFYDVPFPHTLPQIPAVQLQRIAETVDDVTREIRTVLQIDVYDKDLSTAQNLADTIYNVLQGATATTSTERIHYISKVNTVDYYMPETRLHRIGTDYAVKWRFV